MPLNAVLALFAAALWGVGDFSGGMGYKSAPSAATRPNKLRIALRVVLLSHLTSFSVLVAVAFFHRNAFPHGLSLAFALLAGVFGCLSLCAFYIALSAGDMGASAAISGLLAAAVPSAVSLLLEGSPGPHRLVGFLVAAVAIWLIAAGTARREASSTVLLAATAGFGFGLYFVAIKLAAPASPLDTIALARSASITTCLLILSVLHFAAGPSARILVSSRMAVWILSTALFDTAGNLLFAASTRAGRLDIAAVLASFYPASTILLAAAILRERPTPRQLAGMGVAAVAILLITL